MTHPHLTDQPVAAARPAACVSCGAPISSRYCAACGERTVSREDLTLRHFLAEGFESLTSTDSRLFRTLRALLTQPGLLSAAYVAGRRVPYLKPLQIFLLCNLAFFLFQAVTDSHVVDTPLDVHLHNSGPLHEPSHERVFGAPHREDERERMPGFDAFERRFNARASDVAGSLVIVMVPLFAMAVAATFPRRRRLPVEHLVFATHFYAFFLLATPLIALGVIGLVRASLALRWTLPARVFDGSEVAITTLLVSALALHLLFAIRHFYAVGWLAAALRALPLGIATIAVLALYRYLLFYVTLLFV